MVLENYPELRYCRISKGNKKPFETEWQKKGYIFQEIVAFIPKENYGVLCGYGDLIVIDSDTPELQIAVERLLPDTFRVKTGSGGTHNYFFSPEYTEKIVLTDGTKHYGEVQGQGSQVVGAGSTHPNGKQYEKLNDTPIATISKTQLFELVNNFKNLNPSFNYPIQQDFRSLVEKMASLWKKGARNELCLSLSGYLRKEKRLGINTIKAIISQICEIAKDDEVAMRLRTVDETFNKDEGVVKGYTGLKDVVDLEELKEIEIKEEQRKPIQKVHLDVMTYQDLKKFKVNKNFVVESFIYPGSVTMIYSPPAQFKSLIAAGMSFAIANGREFLGMKTKKSAVLYLDGENSQGIMKERAEQIHKGMRLTRNIFPLFFLQGGLLMDSKKNINLPYLVEVENLIKKEKIKIIIFDTLHRFCLYDENSSDDINKLYTEVFKPLADSLGVAVVFLHHSRKDGGYRGSGDFLGMVDVSYRIDRKYKTNEFTIINEKCRSGEIPELKGEIIFGDDYIRFNRMNEILDEKEKINKMVEVTQRVEELFDNASRLQRKDIIAFLEAEKFDFGSTKTVDRSLKFLVEKRKILDKSEKGVYSLILK